MYPHIDKGTLVSISEVGFPEIPGTKFPQAIHTAYRADYGPRWSRGIVDQQPPNLGEAFPSLASQVDEFENEIAGVRNVEIRVPLATYTPWNLRWGYAGGSTELINFQGTYIPLPRTNAERAAAGDPRPSIISLYKSREDYLSQVQSAAGQLVDEGFLLVEDQTYVLERGEQYWDWIHGDKKGSQ